MTNNKDWREELGEFGEIFTFMPGVQVTQGYKPDKSQMYSGRWSNKQIESFIEQTLATQREELAKEIEKHSYIRDMNVARYRNEILALLQTKEETK